jgi:undecaprenyl diphosphate synthase
LTSSPSSSDERFQIEIKKSGQIPSHVAIIMDGNGRWAKKRGLPRAAGHTRGVESVRDIVKACSQLGVRYLTLYTFSTENWRRPQDEVSMLMRLLLKSLRDEADELNQNDIKITMIGDLEALPKEVQKELYDASEKTKNNKKMVLNLALSYSGRTEILTAIKKIANSVAKIKLKPEDINESVLSDHLMTKNMPDPDLVIRTSGEFRVSNFLLWQIAYSEFYISDVLWPDFRRNDLYDAIKSFQKRERRFGKVSEQVKEKV